MSTEISSMLVSVSARIAAIEEKMGLRNAHDSFGAGGDNASVGAFDRYSNKFMTQFVAACSQLGGDAAKVGGVLQEAWAEMRKVVVMAGACKEPSAAELPKILEPMQLKMKELAGMVQRNEWEKHTKTCSEGIGCLNWVAVKPAPCDFIESFIGGSDYWANGIRKEFRTTNPTQIAFCDTFKQLIVELMAYVKEHHRTGLSWNAKGVLFSTSVPASTMPPTAVKSAAASSDSSAPPKGALFAELNKEGAVTSGLKKVTKDMQTWRSEYKSDTAAATPVVKSVSKPSAQSGAAQVKGPPKLQFQEGAHKWLVEYHSEAQGRVNIEIKDKKETVYIFGCINAVIEVKNKCKSIIMDSCKKTTVYFDSAMASCEVVNCQRMNVHVVGSVSSVAIDKTDGIVVHLPIGSLNTEIVASKSSEMNLAWPDANGDIMEKPIPEQYVHRIKDGSVTADVSDLYGH